MARFYPQRDWRSVENDGERGALSLLSSLSDQYHVYHSLQWVRPREREPAVEGEADVVIYHPRGALLVIEVKRGAAHKVGDVWRYESGSPMYKDERMTPLKQAERNVKKIRSLLSDIPSLSWPKLKHFPIRAGVILPAASLPSPLEGYLDAPRAARVCEWVEEMMSASRQVDASVTRAVFQAIFARECRYFTPLSLELNSGEQTLIKLSEVQARVATGLLLSFAERTATRGGAGTGKTEVALHLASALAHRGLKTLLLCYNRHLKVALKTRVHALNAPRDLLCVETIGSLTYRLAREASLKLPQTFDAELVGDLLTTLVSQQRKSGRAATYDALVIDEGQDLDPQQLLDVVDLTLSDPEAGRLHLFYDDKQRVFQEGGATLQDLISLVELRETRPFTVNYRNTKRIAEASSAIFEERAETPEGGLEGAEVTVSAGGVKALTARVSQLMSREGIKLSDLVLLSPRGDGGALNGRRQLAGYPLIFAREERSYERWVSSEGLLVSTARSFKGLEAKVTLIYDLGSFNDRYTPHDLYVGLTRAKGRAELFARSPKVAAEVSRYLKRGEL